MSSSLPLGLLIQIITLTIKTTRTAREITIMIRFFMVILLTTFNTHISSYYNYQMFYLHQIGHIPKTLVCSKYGPTNPKTKIFSCCQCVIVKTRFNSQVVCAVAEASASRNSKRTNFIVIRIFSRASTVEVVIIRVGTPFPDISRHIEQP